MAAKVDVEKCNACESCVDTCPVEAISMVNDKAKVDADECTECEACVEECPEGAISME